MCWVKRTAFRLLIIHYLCHQITANIMQAGPEELKMSPRPYPVAKVENGVDEVEMGQMEPVKPYNTYDVDEAMKVFAELGDEEIIVDEQSNKRLLRIIDWHLMPLMCVVYGMNFLDSKLPLLRHADKENMHRMLTIIHARRDNSVVRQRYGPQ